jgi:hypothetical protein
MAYWSQDHVSLATLQHGQWESQDANGEGTLTCAIELDDMERVAPLPLISGHQHVKWGDCEEVPLGRAAQLQARGPAKQHLRSPWVSHQHVIHYHVMVPPHTRQFCITIPSPSPLKDAVLHFSSTALFCHPRTYWQAAPCLDHGR